MNAADKKKELASLLKARFTTIYVTTSEERRIQGSVIEIGKEQGYDVYLWSISNGMLKVGNSEAENIDDPTQALAYIEQAKVRGIFVLRDFEPFLEPIGANVMTIRKLRELSDDLANLKKNNAKAIIITATKLVLPDSLRSSTVVMDWPLPDREELRSAVVAVDEMFPPDFRSEMPKEKEALEALYTDIATSAQGLTLLEAQNAFALSAIKHRTLRADEVSAYKKQAVARDGLLEWIEPCGGLDEIGGLDLLKAWLLERKLGLTPAARAYGLPEPRGIACVGTPGSGKSLAAKATATAWNLPLIRLDFGALYGSLLGESEANLRKALRTIEAVSPAIVIADELEKGLGGSGPDGAAADGGTSSRILGTFLTWMQEKKTASFVFATLNRVEGLPPELLRAGRWDAVWYVGLPTWVERKAIFQVHLRKRNRKPELFDTGQLALETSGYSGAEIEQVVIDGMFRAFANQQREVVTQDLQAAASALVPLSKTAAEKIEAMRNWAKGRARMASAPESDLAEGGRFSALA